MQPASERDELGSLDGTMSTHPYPSVDRYLRRVAAMFSSGELEGKDLPDVLTWLSARARLIVEAEKAILGKPNIYAEAQKALAEAQTSINESLLFQITGR